MSESQKHPTYWVLILLLFAVAGFWGISPIILGAVFGSEFDWSVFGAAESLFSGLAFSSLVYAIYLQQHELQLQREELRLTRQELKGQKKQLEAQNEVLRKQNFEDTFFQLLRTYNDTVRAIDLQKSGITHAGRDCFKLFLRDLENTFTALRQQKPGVSPEELLMDAYAEIFRTHQGDVAHYFRTLYNIVKFVHASDVPNKRFYTNLVRAQLSSYEVLLLFYNCQSPLGRDKFKPLVEHYGLLKTLPSEQLLLPSQLQNYSQGAYGEG